MPIRRFLSGFFRPIGSEKDRDAAKKTAKTGCILGIVLYLLPIVPAAILGWAVGSAGDQLLAPSSLIAHCVIYPSMACGLLLMSGGVERIAALVAHREIQNADATILVHPFAASIGSVAFLGFLFAAGLLIRSIYVLVKILLALTMLVVRGPAPSAEEAHAEATASAKQSQASEAQTRNLPTVLTNDVGITLSLIPAGTFKMGSPGPKSYDEGPIHKVRITHPFYLSVTATTQAQWLAVMGTVPWEDEDGVPNGMNYPAVNMSWAQADEFCRKLSASSNRVYRLPTEAEWEYACRAGTVTTYNFGNDETKLDEYAWPVDDARASDEALWREVGRKAPNAWGLYDMHGSVREWCYDFNLSDYYRDSPEDDPRGPAMSVCPHVVRGSLWGSRLWDRRSARRGESSDADREIGFRVVMEAAP